MVQVEFMAAGCDALVPDGIATIPCSINMQKQPVMPESCPAIPSKLLGVWEGIQVLAVLSSSRDSTFIIGLDASLATTMAEWSKVWDSELRIGRRPLGVSVFQGMVLASFEMSDWDD